MADTAQAPAGPADPVADAAAAFRALREPASEPKPRAPNGQFTSNEPAPEPVQEIEAVEELPEAVETDDVSETMEEAPEEGQPEALDMPSSWSKEDAEHWNALPPEAQAIIAEREGQREAAVNSKFQEAANARKAGEAQLAEANANRDAYAEAIDTVLSLVSPVEPDPRRFGAGTGNYDREGYDLAVLQYRQQIATVQNLKQQRETISAQQQEEVTKAQKAQFDEIERVARPALLKAVPDIGDPAKAEAALGGIVRYAIAQGIPENVFAENADSITSAELLIAWKASEYDKLQEAKTRVAPKAKTAAPPVRPGVATPRATQQSVALQKDMKRLAQSGSIEDGAAIFRHFRS